MEIFLGLSASGNFYKIFRAKHSLLQLRYNLISYAVIFVKINTYNRGRFS